MAKLSGAPFVKVEVSKFTEVGYVGRDVDSVIRDLVEMAVKLVRDEKEHEVWEAARAQAETKLLDLLLPPRQPSRHAGLRRRGPGDPPEPATPTNAASREKLRKLLAEGKLDDREVEIEIDEEGGGGGSR